MSKEILTINNIEITNRYDAEMDSRRADIHVTLSNNRIKYLSFLYPMSAENLSKGLKLLADEINNANS